MTATSTAMLEPRHFARTLDAAALASWSPLLLRLVVGTGFFMHGNAKLSRGPDTFAAVLHTLGVPLPHLFAWLTTIVELAGGVAVLAGAFVPLVSVPLAAVLLTAMFTIHWPYGFFSVKLVEVTTAGTRFGTVGYEIVLLYLAALGALVLGGAGPLSVDRWRARRRPAPSAPARRSPARQSPLEAATP